MFMEIRNIVAVFFPQIFQDKNKRLNQVRIRSRILHIENRKVKHLLGLKLQLILSVYCYMTEDNPDSFLPGSNWHLGKY